jgi:hypothetical protein
MLHSPRSTSTSSRLIYSDDYDSINSAAVIHRLPGQTVSMTAEAGEEPAASYIFSPNSDFFLHKHSLLILHRHLSPPYGLQGRKGKPEGSKPSRRMVGEPVSKDEFLAPRFDLNVCVCSSGKRWMSCWIGLIWT